MSEFRDARTPLKGVRVKKGGADGVAEVSAGVCAACRNEETQ